MGLVMTVIVGRIRFFQGDARRLTGVVGAGSGLAGDADATGSRQSATHGFVPTVSGDTVMFQRIVVGIAFSTGSSHCPPPSFDDDTHD